MARLESQMSFTEEVDFNDIQFDKVVGKGAFGVVSKATWQDINVAVKMIESEDEIKAFKVELSQLSRVDHPNIVKLYGACTTRPVCLVMEYAEGGSLYNVLHSSQPQPIYRAAHAMSWALQCARGVDYLHSMSPKKLIHRDLKPANLLLMSGGTVLKICDFGTACDYQTYMTNNKGSAAWMAPEVFEGSLYSEKCDVFSWGIILWEVISRRKPFDDIGGPAFRIMWAVHEGRRPPLIRNIPKPLEKLMTRCWSKEPKQRPAMHEVVSIMANLMQFFKGADQPLVYPQVSDKDNEGVSRMANRLAEQVTDLSLGSNPSMDSRGSTVSDTVIHSSTSHSNGPPQEQKKIETHIPFSELPAGHLSDNRDQKKRHSMDLLDLRVEEDNSAKSAVQTHRRSNSHGRILDMDFPAAFIPLPIRPSPAPQTRNPPPPPPPTTRIPLHQSASSPSISSTSLIAPTPPTSGFQTPTPNSTSTPTLTPTPTPPQKPVVPPTRPPMHSISVPHDLSSSSSSRQRPISHPNNLFGGLSPSPASPYHPHRHSSADLREYREGVSHVPQHQNPPPPSYPHHAVLEQRMGGGSTTTTSSGGSGGAGAGAGAGGGGEGSFSAQGRFDRSQSLDPNPASRIKNEDSDISMAYSTLEPHLQPLPPNPNSKESQEIFDEHLRMAQEFLRTQTEMALLHTRKKELAEALDQDWKDQQASFRLVEEFNTLQGEKESLLDIHKRRRSQLDMFRVQVQRQQQQHWGNRRM